MDISGKVYSCRENLAKEDIPPMAGSMEVPEGLQNVTVTTSAITYIGKDPDCILYRGYDLGELSRVSTYEETAYLLLHGDLPGLRELEKFSQFLRSRRRLTHNIEAILSRSPAMASPMDVLTTLVSGLGTEEARKDWGPEVLLETAVRIIAVFPTMVASQARAKSGLPPVPPREDLPHAANFLYMLKGTSPSMEDARTLDSMLILHADNELNTSTYSAMVTASTLADMFSAVVSAMCTLKGPLHGGASEQVMNMLEEIGSLDAVDGYVRTRLSTNQRIPGFGHRVFTAEDPRATILRELSRTLSLRKGDSRWFEMLQSLEKVVGASKKLPCNLDLYSGSVYSLLGISKELFTPLFAAGRTVGWTAHIMEEYGKRKLISPMARYTGMKARRYVPIKER